MSSCIKKYLVLLLCTLIAGGQLVLAPHALADLLAIEPHMFTVEPLDGSTIRLQWNRRAGVEGVQIFRAESSGGPYTLATVAYDIVWHDTGLTCGQAYHYKLKAFRGDELGTDSVVKAAMPLDAPDVTGMSEMAFVDGNLCTTVSWSFVTEAEGYTLYRGAGEDYVGGPVFTGAGLEAVCKLPDEPGSYYFIAKAFKTGADGILYEGPFGSAILFTVSGDSLAIGSEFGLFPIDGSTIAVKWAKPADVEGAQIYRAEAAGGPFELAGTAYEAVWFDAGLTAGRLYYYQLCAFRGDEVGEASAVKSGVPLDEPIVTNVSESFTDDGGWIHVNVSFSAVSEADGYKLCRGVSGSPLYELRATTGATSAEDVLPGEPGSYWYTVLAYKVVGGTEYEGPHSSAYPYTVASLEPGRLMTWVPWTFGTPTRVPPETPPTPTPTPRRFNLPILTKTPRIQFWTPTPKPTKVFGPTPIPTKAVKITPTPTPTPTPKATIIPLTTLKIVLPTPTPTKGFKVPGK